jgi:hypothetical protein
MLSCCAAADQRDYLRTPIDRRPPNMMTVQEFMANATSASCTASSCHGLDEGNDLISEVQECDFGNDTSKLTQERASVTFYR